MSKYCCFIIGLTNHETYAAVITYDKIRPLWSVGDDTRFSLLGNDEGFKSESVE